MAKVINIITEQTGTVSIQSYNFFKTRGSNIGNKNYSSFLVLEKICYVINVFGKRSWNFRLREGFHLGQSMQEWTK